LAWVSNITHTLAAIVNVHSDDGVKTMIQIGIIVCITLLNLSIQPRQNNEGGEQHMAVGIVAKMFKLLSDSNFDLASSQITF
jgi:hypothetical protein